VPRLQHRASLTRPVLALLLAAAALAAGCGSPDPPPPKPSGDLDAAGFEDLPRNDRSIPEPDGFNYVVAYRGHLIVREQSGLEPKLQPVVKRLQTIIDSRR
jgi:hypothetical protein